MFEEYLVQPICGKWERIHHPTEIVKATFDHLCEERLRTAWGSWFRDPVNEIIMIGPDIRDLRSTREYGKGRTYYLFSYQKDTFAVDCKMNDQTDWKGDKIIKYSLDDATLLIAHDKQDRTDFYRYVSSEMLLQGWKEELLKRVPPENDGIEYVTINFARTEHVTLSMLCESMHLW